MEDKPVIKIEQCKSCVCDSFKRDHICKGCITEEEEYKTKKKYLSKPSRYMKKGKTFRQIISHIKRSYSRILERGEKIRTNTDTQAKIRLAVSRSKMYADLLGFNQRDVIEALVANNSRNSYKEWHNSLMPKPTLNIKVYETRSDFDKEFPSGKFICHHCKEEITDPYKCNSDKIPLSRTDECKMSSKIASMVGEYKNMNSIYSRVYFFVIKDEFMENPGIQIIHKPIELIK
jgi:hypothetical protein